MSKVDIQELRNRVRTKLYQQKVVVFGVGKPAEEFINKYNETLNIIACITDYAIEKQEMKCNNGKVTIPIYKFQDFQMEEDTYLVIATCNNVIAENLISSYGLRLFDEYILDSVVDAFLTNKKLALVAGNCQLATVYHFLEEIKAFTDEYEVFKQPIHLYKSRHSKRIWTIVSGLCDLYICAVHKEGDTKYFSRSELPEHCTIVTVPTLITRLYWPQTKVGREQAQNEYFIKDKSTEEHGPFEYGDININTMIESGKSVEEVIKTISDDNFYKKEEIDQHLYGIFRTFEYIEIKSDIKLSDYIKEHYSSELLYKDPIHMQVKTIIELTRRILQHLSIDTIECDLLESDNANSVAVDMFKRHCTEIPIYPSVAKHMGLDFVNQDTTYDVTFYNGIQKLKFEEYVRKYYEVCSMTKKLLEDW